MPEDLYIHERRLTGKKQCELIDDIEGRLIDGDERMDRIEAKIDSNSAETTEVLDILRLGKSFFRIAGYFGTFVKWVSGIVAAIAMAWSALRGKP